MPFDVARARAETPGATRRIHFNNCGAALMPAPVIEAVDAHLKLEAEVGGYEAADLAQQQLDHAYAAVARLLNAAPDEVAMVPNATVGWCMALYAFPFQPGDRILTAQCEYATNFITYLHAARRCGATVEVVASDPSGQLDVDALERMIDERVKLIALAHVPTNGGLVQPARDIGRLARQRGVPFMLDACQSAGQMPLDVEDLCVDVLTATGRKYLRGPRGTGFLYVRRRWLERLEPPMLDLWSAEWVAPERYAVRPDAKRFETWERFCAGQIGLGVAVDYALQWGLAAIYARVRALAERLRAKLAELPGVRVHDLGVERCGIVTFTAEQRGAEALADALRRRGVNTRRTLANSTLLDMRARNLDVVVRAGLHYYNTEDEVDEAIEILADLL